MSVGIHVAKSSKIKNTAYKSMEDAIKAETQLLGLNAVQIFTSGPRNFKRNEMNYQKIKKYCDDEKINISTHGTYVSVGIWKINHKNKNAAEATKQIDHIIDLARSAKQLGGLGVVIHLPKRVPEEIVETLEVLSENKELSKLQNSGDGVLIVLEMPASKPDDKTYETADKLNHLCQLIHSNKNILIKWCLCIDTSHQWSCGIKMDEPHTWNAWLSDLSDFTRNKIKIIHLNGNSSSNFGRGKDVHEIIMSPSDGIWNHLMSAEMSDFIKENGKEIIKENNDFFTHLSNTELKKLKESSLYAIILFAKTRSIPLILEVNRGDFIYTKYAIDIIKGLL